MIKNKYETKLLLNEWRKVLNEGLYDKDPEVLEEMFSKASREKIKNLTAAGLTAGLMFFTSLGSALGDVTGVSAATKRAIEALNSVVAGETVIDMEGDPTVKYFKENRKTIDSIFKKLESKNLEEFDEKEAVVFKKLISESQRIIEVLEKIIKHLETKIEKEQDAFVAIEYYKLLNEFFVIVNSLQGKNKSALDNIRKQGDEKTGAYIENIENAIDQYFGQ